LLGQSKPGPNSVDDDSGAGNKSNYRLNQWISTFFIPRTMLRRNVRWAALLTLHEQPVETCIAHKVSEHYIKDLLRFLWTTRNARRSTDLNFICKFHHTTTASHTCRSNAVNKLQADQQESKPPAVGFKF